MPRFSAIVCVRDRIAKLETCLRCLAACSSEATGELIVVCDGGGAQVRAKAEPLLAIPGWESRWIDTPPQGPAKCRNRALDVAAGELILFLNDDIRFPPGLLAAHHRTHLLRPGHAVMGNTRWAPEAVSSDFMHWVAHHDSFYYLIPGQLDATWEYFHTMNLSVDRRWFDGGARFDEAFPDPAFEDTELGYRLWQQGLKIAMAWDAELYHDHTFAPAEYVEKSAMRGRSARRFCELYPELRDRIISEYQALLRRERSPRARLRRLLRPHDPIEQWELQIAKAFLRGYEEGPG